MRKSYDPSDGMQKDLAEVIDVPINMGVINDTYVKRGDPIFCLGFNRVMAYVDYKENDSTGYWLKALIGHEEGEVDYEMPSYAVSEAELDGNDVGGVKKATVEFILDGLVQYVQVLTKAVSLGAVPATIEKMIVTRSWV